MNNYSEKELKIFGGVLALAQQGTQLTQMTAKQIAHEAGVGKGTIYDYISSKEEIVVKALVYNLENSTRIINRKLDMCESYRDKMFCLYHRIIDSVSDSFSIYNIIISIGGPEKVYNYFRQTENCFMLTQALEGVLKVFTGVTEFGIKTGRINGTDPDYVSMTVNANIYSVGKERTEKKIPPDKICEYAYNMLIKALS